MKLRSLTSIASLVFLSLLLVTSAQARPYGKGHHGGGHMKKMMEQLNLSDEQQEQVKSIFQNFRESKKSQKEQMRSERKALKELMHQDTLNEDQVRQQFRKVSSLKEELMVERAKMMHQVRSILTDEQKARLKELKQEWRDKWKNKHGKRHHGQES